MNVMQVTDLKQENAFLILELQEATAGCLKTTRALEQKLHGLYRRNDALEQLLRDNNIPVPPFTGLEESV